MIHFKINESIYHVPLFIFIGEYSDYQEVLRKKYNLNCTKQLYFGGESKILTQRGNAICIIWLPKFDYNNAQNMATLVHELDHTTFYILEHINIPILDNQSNHAYIYLKEYFLTKALKKLKGAENGN